MEVQYYRIKDVGCIGKMADDIPYVYAKGEGWKVDNENILMDRLMGYDGEVIGSTAEMDNIDEISEDEALSLILQ